MRVGIDICNLFGGGDYDLGRWTEEFLKALGRYGGTNDYIVFAAPGRVDGSWGALSPRFQVVEINSASRRKDSIGEKPDLNSLWHQLQLPTEVLNRRINLVHSFCPVVPLSLSSLNDRKGKESETGSGVIKSIATVSDIMFHFEPGLMAPESGYLQKWAAISLKKAGYIVAPSHFTKKMLVDIYGIDDERIEVIYPEVGSDFHSMQKADELNRVRKKYSLPERFLLYTGSLGPSSNLIMLLRSFSEAKRNFKLPHKLVVASRPQGRIINVEALSEQLGLKGEVSVHLDVSRVDLPLLYAAADLFVYLPIYGGLSISLIESMAAGLPSLASRSASIPEIVADGAVLVDPEDIPMIVQSMIKLLSDNDLRCQIRGKGLARVRELTKHGGIQRLIALYEKAILG